MNNHLSALKELKETTLAIRANVISSTQDTLFYCKCASSPSYLPNVPASLLPS